jgi:hypothetical protein
MGEITTMHTNYPTWTPKYLACLQKIIEALQNHTALLSPPPCLAISICDLITALSSGSHFFLAFVARKFYISNGMNEFFSIRKALLISRSLHRDDTKTLETLSASV